MTLDVRTNTIAHRQCDMRHEQRTAGSRFRMHYALHRSQSGLVEWFHEPADVREATELFICHLVSGHGAQRVMRAAVWTARR